MCEAVDGGCRPPKPTTGLGQPYFCDVSAAEGQRIVRMTPQRFAGIGPVVPEERMYALDVLRGWAMFGVLWSNLNDAYGTTEPVTAFDRTLEWTQT